MARTISPSNNQVQTVYSAGGFAAGDYVFRTSTGFEKATNQVQWPILSNAYNFNGANVNVGFGFSSAENILIGPSQTGGIYSGSAVTAYTQSVAATNLTSTYNYNKIYRLANGNWFVHYYDSTSGNWKGNVLNSTRTTIISTGTLASNPNVFRVFPMADGSVAVGYFNQNANSPSWLVFVCNSLNSYTVRQKYVDSSAWGGYNNYMPGVNASYCTFAVSNAGVGYVTVYDTTYGYQYILKWNLFDSSLSQLTVTSTNTSLFLNTNASNNIIYNSVWDLTPVTTYPTTTIYQSFSGSVRYYFYDTQGNSRTGASLSTGTHSVGVTYTSTLPALGCTFLRTGTTYGSYATVVSSSATQYYLDVGALDSLGRPSGAPTFTSFTPSTAIYANNFSIRVFALGSRTTIDPPLAICYYVTQAGTGYPIPVFRIATSTGGASYVIGSETQMLNGQSVNGNQANVYDRDIAFNFSPYVAQIETNFFGSGTTTYYTGNYGFGVSSPAPFAYGGVLSPEETGPCVGVALTSASAGSTGKILIRGTAEVRSGLPSAPAALSFNHANYAPGGIMGTVTGRTVTFEGIDG